MKPRVIINMESNGTTYHDDATLADARDYANARLIAAAPELLAALKNVEELLYLEAYANPNDDDVDPLYTEIRAAIDKAEGR